MIEKVRLALYEPWGRKLATVTEYSSLSWVHPLNSHSTLSVSFPDGAADSAVLKRLYTRSEIALEAKINGKWVEPFSCRFFPASQSLDRVKSGDGLRLTYVGISSALRWASVWEPTAGDEEGKRVFSAQTPGLMLHTLMDAAKKRGGTKGWAPGLSYRFTGQVDSSGHTWGKNAANSFTPSASLEKVLDWLASKGAVDWRTSGRELQVYNSDTEMSKRLENVRFRDAFATSTPQTVSLESLATVARFRGENGVIFERENPSAFDAFGRIERWSEQGQVKLEPTANLYLEELLKRGEAPLEQHRREWSLTPDAPCLWSDYQVGDWVETPAGQLRIVEAGLTVSENGEINGFDTLGTRIQAILERLARKTTDLSDGMVGGENSPVTFRGADGNPGTPTVPTGLTATSDAYLAPDGFTRSVVSLRWNAVTKTVDGQPVAVDRYRIRITKANSPDVYREASGTSYSLEGTPGEKWTITVQAASRQQALSGFSAPVAITLASDSEAPPKPTAPIVTCDREVAFIRSDGRAATGAPMPPDVDHWDISVTHSVGTTDVSATAAAAGDLAWYQAGLTPNTTYYVRIRAVDRSGNVGPWSEHVSLHVTASKTGVGALDEYLITGGVLQTSKQRDRGVKVNGSGIVAYDDLGRQTVRITGQTGELSGVTITGGLIRTNADSAEGLRIQDDTLKMLHLGRTLVEMNRRSTRWNAADGGSHIVVEPEGARKRVELRFGTTQEWTKNYGSIFIVDPEELNHSKAYEVGAFIVSGNEKEVNKSGRAELVLGEGSKWKLSTVYGPSYAGVESGYDGHISMTADAYIDVYSKYGNIALQVHNGGEVRLEGIQQTSGGIPLAIVDGSNGQGWSVAYQGSARRLKMDITTVERPERVLDLQPRDWYDRAEYEAYANYLEDHAPGGAGSGKWDAHSQKPSRVPGLVAEEVEEAGLTEYVTYRNGQTSGVRYDRLWTLLIPIVKDLSARLEAAEQKLTEAEK